ncbi:MAG: hypothetical protein NVSMB27_09000 [Ktedonobacteraceae bacterium]
MKTTEYTTPTGQERLPHLQSKQWSHSRLSTFLRSLAAVLIAAALLGSFIALLTYRHSSGTGPSQPSTQAYKRPLVAVAGSDGTIYALQPSTGTMLWHYATHQPVVAMIQQDGAVYISAEGTLEQPAVSEPSFLYKLRASDGALLWKRNSFSTSVFMAVDSDIIITSEGRSEGLIRAFNASNGSLLWQHPTESGVGSGWGNAMITEHNHVLYLRYLAHGLEGLSPEAIVSIKAFDIKGGNLLWTSTEFPHLKIETAVFTDKAMYVIAHDTDTYNQSVVMLDLRNGKMLKRMNLPPGESMISDGFDAGILYVNRFVLKRNVVVLNAYICAIRIADGTSLACAPTFPNNVANVTGIDHMFYYQQEDTTNNIEQVIARNKDDGKSRWRWTIPGNYSPSYAEYMVAYNGIVYVTTLHGIFALQGSDGRILWHVLATTNLEAAGPSVPGHTYQLPNP